MRLSTNVAKTTVIILTLLMCTITLSVILTQPVQAQLATEQAVSGALPNGANPSITITTEAFLSVSPTTIGLGQTFLVNMWMHPPIHVERRFTDAFLVTITKPSGDQIKVGPLSSYQGDGTAWFEYIGDEVGTWKLKFDFLGMWYPAGRYYYSKIVTNSSGTNLGSAYYKPASTREVQLVVQQEQIASWPPAPLPTDYWTRPVNPVNREWWPILGSYPAAGVVGGGQYWPDNTNIYASNYNFIPYVQGPNSAHIIWKRQIMIGGLLGGSAGQTTESRPVNPVRGYPTIIYAGRVYDSYTKPGSGKDYQTYWRCVDIRTGELIWERPLQAGESEPNIVEYMAQNEEVPGAAARAAKTIYLVSISGGRILKYDPWTGVLEVNVTGPPTGVSGATLYARSSVLSVQTIGSGAAAKYRLINWTIQNNGGLELAGASGRTTVDNFTQRIINNITWPFNSIGVADYEAGVAVVSTGVSSTGTGVNIGQRIMAASLTTGQLLWNITTDLDTGLETFFSGETALADHGKFAARIQNGQWYCWDLYSGKQLWKSELSGWPWGVFGPYSSVSAYGYLYSYDFVQVSAINWETGKTEWTFKSPTPVQFETPYQGYYSWHGAAKAADGKLYVYNGEHTPSQPVTRGWRLYCLNATSGEHIWDIPMGQLIWNTIWYNLGGIPGSRVFQGAIADGYLVATNEYDGYLYSFGKGKSTTTVTAPDVAVSKGIGITIKGTVMDLSPAQPNTPCVSKESMSLQMEYLHMQMPIDGLFRNETVTGVPVALTAISSDGTYTDLGTITTDGYYGTFSKTWVPDKEGDFKIIASFAGDDSYGSSAASTSVSVGPAATEISIPEQITPPDYTTTIIAGVIAVIITVVLVGVVLYRKK